MTEPNTAAGRAMEEWLREPEDYEWGRKVTNAILAIEAEAHEQGMLRQLERQIHDEQQDGSALRLLREVDSVREFLRLHREATGRSDVNIRKVLALLDQAIEVAALPPSAPPALDDHDINCGIDALRLGEDIGCTCYARRQEPER